MNNEPYSDLSELIRRQRFSLWLDGREGLQTTADAQAFLGAVSLALRYGATADLPLASLYRATQRHIPLPEREKGAHARAFELTNNLLAGGEAVEINVVANRLALVHVRLMPPIFAMLRDGPGPELSDLARRAFDFIIANECASSGDVRRHLGVIRQARPDPGDLALTELQRHLLVDRGPAGSQARGIFYLSKEGYPYRVFEKAHPDIASAAAVLNRAQAAVDVLDPYLRAALFAFPRKLHTMFQLLLGREEIDAAITSLVKAGDAKRARLGKAEAVVYSAAAT